VRATRLHLQDRPLLAFLVLLTSFVVTVGNIYYMAILQWLVILALIVFAWTLGSPLASAAVHRVADSCRRHAASGGCRSLAVPAAVGDAAGFLFLAGVVFPCRYGNSSISWSTPTGSGPRPTLRATPRRSA
jgi:hypothetical protein